MKKESGITLLSLVIYIVVMSIVLVVMSMIIENFYENTTKVQADIEEIVEFNKFNNYFLKEVKLNNNKVDSISDNYILFASGNSFSISNGSIYYNNIKICEGVNECTFIQEVDENGVVKDENIINVTLTFENFEKIMNYKIENIY